MSAPALPPGWSVELQGLTACVVFRHTDGRSLVWVDAAWYVCRGQVAMPALGVPAASTMAAARVAGAEFVARADG